MNYNFLDKSINIRELILPPSDKIDASLLSNHQNEIIKAIDFINSEEKFLYIHGFLGTGKRQFINYIKEFLSKEVVRLEYFCKQATVCDDVLLAFNEKLEQGIYHQGITINPKITTLSVKFQQLVNSTKKPILIILHSLDDILEENFELIISTFSSILKNENVKIIISTRALKTNILGNLEEDQKIFLKALTKNHFVEYLQNKGITATDTVLEDFYKYTRGYYYYTALSVKLIQAMKIDLSEFLIKFGQSEMSFDKYLGMTYINYIPTAIKNFFWFLKTLRHGLSLNALALLELYDEFSIEYLKQNLIIFMYEELVFVQDYFLQDLETTIPDKTKIKLHKYIIGIYEKQLKQPLQNRAFTISRQALRAEIEYHSKCILKAQNKLPDVEIENGKQDSQPEKIAEPTNTKIEKTILEHLEQAKKLDIEKKYTDAIEAYCSIIEMENIDLQTLIECRTALAKLYKQIENYPISAHYYELAETYYIQHNENINLNYLYYEMTDLYYKMYKPQRAIDTIKKVIYSVDTPQSLLVSSCLLLGNIYSDINNYDEAYSYYKKALDSLDDNDEENIIAELYFRFALVNDDKEDSETAFDYYNKCISIQKNNPYIALSYSNMASCYFDKDNYDDALFCFQKAYEIEKTNNNFEGVYYTASHIAKIHMKKDNDSAYDYLIEAKKSAEFINEDFYILEATIALGDYYYNKPESNKKALREYFKALKLSKNFTNNIDINKIEKRIQDMKFRMTPDDFKEIKNKYAK